MSTPIQIGNMIFSFMWVSQMKRSEFLDFFLQTSALLEIVIAEDWWKRIGVLMCQIAKTNQSARYQQQPIRPYTNTNQSTEDMQMKHKNKYWGNRILPENTNQMTKSPTLGPTLKGLQETVFSGCFFQNFVNYWSGSVTWCHIYFAETNLATGFAWHNQNFSQISRTPTIHTY